MKYLLEKLYNEELSDSEVFLDSKCGDTIGRALRPRDVIVVDNKDDRSRTEQKICRMKLSSTYVALPLSLYRGQNYEAEDASDQLAERGDVLHVPGDRSHVLHLHMAHTEEEEER